MKSNELQGLRGVAVIAVVLFHLKVDYVGRGFLGVDIFFVLSGYFMARALYRKTIDYEKAMEFYKRRVKRLLPAFALLLFSVTITVPWFFILTELDTAANEIGLSMPFTINLKFAAETQNYWTKDKNFSSVVMHLWSLALEMQFYLVVPVIYCVVNRLRNHNHRVAAHLSLLGASLLSHYFDRSESRRFYLLHNRLWEFLVGFVVQEFEQEIKEKRKCSSGGGISLAATCILLWLMSGTEMPARASTMLFFRIVTVSCTAAIVCFSGSAGNSMLSARWLVYVGDVSYVLYLIHWPVIVLVHSYVIQLHATDILLCIGVSLALSALAHHLFEKPLLTRNFKDCFSISMVFYALTLLALACRLPQNLSERIIRYRQDDNSTLYNLMEWNYRESGTCCNTLPVDCARDIEMENWLGYKKGSTGRCVKQGNGAHKVLVIGNSVSMSSFATVHKVLDGRYSTLRLFSRQGCWMLFGTCDDFWKAVMLVVEIMKPDIILITESQRLMNERPDDGTILKRAQHRINYLRTRSKAVMVDTQYLIPDFPHSNALAHSLARGQTDLSVSSMPLEEQLSLKHVAYDRITALRGGNVVINNITFAFCERVKGVCEGYDPTTLKAYTQTGVHINSYGYKLLESRYKRSIDRVIEIASRY